MLHNTSKSLLIASTTFSSNNVVPIAAAGAATVIASSSSSSNNSTLHHYRSTTTSTPYTSTSTTYNSNKLIYSINYNIGSIFNISSRFYSTTTTTTKTHQPNNINNPSYRLSQHNQKKKDNNNNNEEKERRIMANGALRYSKQELKTISLIEFEKNTFLMGNPGLIANELKRYIIVHLHDRSYLVAMTRLLNLYEQLLIETYKKEKQEEEEMNKEGNDTDEAASTTIDHDTNYDISKVAFFLDYFISIDHLEMVNKLLHGIKQLSKRHKLMVAEYLYNKITYKPTATNNHHDIQKSRSPSLENLKKAMGIIKFTKEELKETKHTEHVLLLKAYSLASDDDSAALVLSSMLSQKFSMSTLLVNESQLHDWLQLIFRDENQRYFGNEILPREFLVLFQRSMNNIANQLINFVYYRPPQVSYHPNTNTPLPLKPDQLRLEQEHNRILHLQKKAMETIFAYFSRYGKEPKLLEIFIQTSLNRFTVPLDELFRTLRDADDYESVLLVYRLCLEHNVVITAPSAQIILERMLQECPNEIPKLISAVITGKPANFALLYMYNESIGNYSALDLFEKYLLSLVKEDTQYLLYNFLNHIILLYLIEGNYSQALAHLGRASQHYNSPPHYQLFTLFEIYHQLRQEELEQTISNIKQKRGSPFSETEQTNLQELSNELNWNYRLFKHWKVNVDPTCPRRMSVFKHYKEFENDPKYRLSTMYNFIISESNQVSPISIPKMSEGDKLLKEEIKHAKDLTSVSKIFDLLIQQFLSVGILPYGDLLIRAMLTIKHYGGVQAYMDCRKFLPPETRAMTFMEGDFGVALQTNFNSTFSYIMNHEHIQSIVGSELIWNSVISELANSYQTERLLKVKKMFELQGFIYTSGAVEAMARHMYTLGRWSDEEMVSLYKPTNSHIPLAIRPTLSRLQQCEMEHLLAQDKCDEAFEMFQTMKTPTNNTILSTIFKVIDAKLTKDQRPFVIITHKLITLITPYIVGNSQQHVDHDSISPQQQQQFGVTWSAFYKLFFARLFKAGREDLVRHYIKQNPEYFQQQLSHVSKTVVHQMIRAQSTPSDVIQVFLQYYTPLWTRCSKDLHTCLLTAYNHLAPNDRDPSVLQKINSFDTFTEKIDSFDNPEPTTIFYQSLNFIDHTFINNPSLTNKVNHKQKYFEMRKATKIVDSINSNSQ